MGRVDDYVMPMHMIGMLRTFYRSLSIHVPLRGFSEKQFCLFSLTNNIRFRLAQFAACLVEKPAHRLRLYSIETVIRLTDCGLYVYEA